jgi:signal transduction histidine kinase
VEGTVVRVTDENRIWRVTVRDKGRGFDLENVRRGFGLDQSISRRLVEVGGDSRVTSTPGSGTKVELWVPA